MLGLRALEELETLVIPDILLGWHRLPIAQQWTYASKGSGRPRVAQEITDLALRMARGLEYTEKTWHRSRSCARETYLVEEALESALGGDGGH